MTLEPIDPDSHDYAAEEAALNAHIDAMFNGGEPIIYFGNGDAPRGAYDPWHNELNLPYGGVPPEAPELTATFSREDWQLLHDLATAKLDELRATGTAGNEAAHTYHMRLDVLQENLSQLVDPEHG